MIYYQSRIAVFRKVSTLPSMKAFAVPCNQASVVAASASVLQEEWREPLAVLMLGTDILRCYSDILPLEERRQQWQAMRAAARNLEMALAAKSDPTGPVCG